MLNILRMNPSGTDGIRTIMTFEFVIDSTNDLPKDEIITLGERIYVIANDSIAINSKNNYTYSFNNGKWIKTNTKTTPSDNTITSNGNYTIPSSTVTGTGNVNIKTKVTTLVDKEITENGTYNASDDEADGYSQVVVDVAPPSNEFYPSTKTQSLMTQNDTGDTWSTKSWSGLTSFYGKFVWTDGDNIYYSGGSDQYVLDKATSTWSRKTWNGLIDLYGSNIWTDGDNIYCRTGSGDYVLDKATSTWSTKTWNGSIKPNGSGIWTDGDNIYYTKQVGATSCEDYVLDKSTSTWSAKTWDGIIWITTSGSITFTVNDIWTDGDNIYYSSKISNQYYLPITKKSFPKPSIRPQS